MEKKSNYKEYTEFKVDLTEIENTRIRSFFRMCNHKLECDKKKSKVEFTRKEKKKIATVSIPNEFIETFKSKFRRLIIQP